MTVKKLLLTIGAIGVLSTLSAPAWAEQIPIIPPDTLKAGCKRTGGIYLPRQPGPNGTWGCVSGNGTITLCGGVKPAHKRTCTQARVQGSDNRTFLGDRLGVVR